MHPSAVTISILLPIYLLSSAILVFSYPVYPHPTNLPLNPPPPPQQYDQAINIVYTLWKKGLLIFVDTIFFRP